MKNILASELIHITKHLNGSQHCMDANDKLNILARREMIKAIKLWSAVILGSLISLGLTFNYFYNDEWSQTVVSGVVTKVVPQPSDAGHYFVIEVDLGDRVILISENYPPGIIPGEEIQIRISSNVSGTKNKYFRLRNPRT